MNLGSCFGIFIAVALVLLCLFCLLLKWFEYLQKRKRNQQRLQFQTLQETNESTQDQDYQGAYQQYCEKQSQRNRELKESLLDKDQITEFSLKRQMTKISNDLYGLSSLRQKLNRQVDEFISFTKNPIISLKQLSLDRIKTIQTKANDKPLHIGHEFIKKLVCYSKQGINIIEVQVQSLSKRGEKIMLKKQVKQNLIQNDQPEFQSFLQTLGFQKLAYNCFKIVCKINTSPIKNNSTCSFKFLQVEQRKQKIGLKQYEKLLDRIKNNDLVSTALQE